MPKLLHARRKLSIWCQGLNYGTHIHSELDSRYRVRMRTWYLPALGVMVCSIAAGILALIFGATSLEIFLPLMFLPIIILIAIRFGNAAGQVGTIAAATIFAAFLFQPTFSLKVHDAAQRSSLIWMIIGGIAMSELLGSSPHQHPRA
jgi:K+-sensing histidine kinase KdpD